MLSEHAVNEPVYVIAEVLNDPADAKDLDQVAEAAAQAVALLETHFKKVLEIDIYVPVTTKRPGRILDRVQGVGVVAVGKYKLTGRP